MFLMPPVTPIEAAPTPPEVVFNMPDYDPALVPKVTDKSNDKNKSSGRDQSVKLAAESVAAQEGFVYYMHAYQRQVERQSHSLDALFSFQFLMMGEHMLPPVIDGGRYVFSVNSSANEAQSAHMEYRITTPAKIVTHVPTWRDYLDPSINPPSKPNTYLMPTDDHEKIFWHDGFIAGWNIGRQQASMMMNDQIHTLERDYVGMLRYHVLVDSGIITPPMVARNKLDQAGDANQLDIGNQTIKITVPAHFTQDSNWRALMERSQNAQPLLKQPTL